MSNNIVRKLAKPAVVLSILAVLGTTQSLSTYAQKKPTTPPKTKSAANQTTATPGITVLLDNLTGGALSVSIRGKRNGTSTNVCLSTDGNSSTDFDANQKLLLTSFPTDDCSGLKTIKNYVQVQIGSQSPYTLDF